MESANRQGFTFDMAKGNSSIIKVIGVGGGGNNALKHMYERGINGVDFIICNTDAQALDNNPVSNKVQLGLSTTEGLGAGADPEVGEKAAIESIDDIKSALGQNTKMIFITAGMGGGTGTGAAPVIAKAAREMGILTVAIVTVPFTFEGKRRVNQAEVGLEKLRQNVDSLIVINNDKLRQQHPNLGFKEGFAKANEVLTNAAKGMAEVITGCFEVNIDFRDAKSVLQNSGTALMSTGIASGENKAEEAIKKALDSPLLNDNKITGAKNVLLLILSGNQEATMEEIGLVNDYVQREAGDTADIIFGVGTAEELGDSISVLIIATGFSKGSEKKIHIGESPRTVMSLDSENHTSSHKPSPFSTRAEREEQVKSNTHEDKRYFSLDDDMSSETPIFKVKTFDSNTAEASPMTEVEVVEYAHSENFNEGEEEHQEITLFNYEEELNANSFQFEVEKVDEIETETNPSAGFTAFSEEKPIQFSFKVDKEEYIATDGFFVKEKEEITPLAHTEIFPEPTQEADNQAKSSTEFGEAQQEFTFIEKPTGIEKVSERRNKLQEFNSRYQVIDEKAHFESVPAFKRKNIVINEFNPSEQSVQNFITENDGKIELKENKFLNKDVD